MFKINSLYVAAVDMDRAENFYSSLIFNTEPKFKTDRFVFYEINGFLFGIFDPRITDETIAYGNNCVPTIECDDLKEFYQKLIREGVEVVMHLQEVNDTVIFQCQDSEGNTLEFYQWK
ncbi:MAG: hypothetical protein QNJ22_22810 [Desulfosarcinaceae bacterium]|nr:hypothetical protein [Desulfosarcinaceae bacterium]